MQLFTHLYQLKLIQPTGLNLYVLYFVFVQPFRCKNNHLFYFRRKDNNSQAIIVGNNLLLFIEKHKWKLILTIRSLGVSTFV